MRAFGRVVAAGVVVLVLAAMPPLATADCEARPLSFHDTVTDARRVVIGDVVAFKPGVPRLDGRSAQFTVKVTDVVRGGPTDLVDLDANVDQPCSQPIAARLGDRIALALDAPATSAFSLTAAAWINGDPPEGFERTTVDDVYRLVGVPLPAPRAVDRAPATPEPPPFWLGPVIAGLAIGLVFVIVAVVGRRVGGTQ